jgi:hypothetical protein
VQAGGSPAAAHFSCFAKKSKQKKATQASLPFGFPIVQYKKWESLETRYALPWECSLASEHHYAGKMQAS